MFRELKFPRDIDRVFIHGPCQWVADPFYSWRVADSWRRLTVTCVDDQGNARAVYRIVTNSPGSDKSTMFNR